MELRDSRRLTGPNLHMQEPGAVVEVSLAPEEATRAVHAWKEQARRILTAVGWEEARLFHQVVPCGVSLALSAPLDALSAATAVNEWAWAAAVQVLKGGSAPETAGDALCLRARIDAESDPPLRALRAAAEAHGVALLCDEELVSVGLGTGCRAWPARELPAPEEVDWKRIHDVPVALVAGARGRCATAHMLAEIARAAGKAVGAAVGGREGGPDPGGARRTLREPGTELAILETVRGGMLRHGLAVERAKVAVVTDVAADGPDPSGVHDLDALAGFDLIVARVAERLVLNADDLPLRRRGREARRPVTWFSTDPGYLPRGEEALLLSEGVLYHSLGDARTPVTDERAVPAALGGADRHALACALAAAAAARALGLDWRAVAKGLKQFQSTPETNPGRLNAFELGGVRVLVDFAHDPHGLAALFEMAAALKPARTALVLGRPGGRDDDAVRELARIAWSARPELVIVEDLREYLRGRPEGEVPRMLEEELRALGAPPEALARAASEVEAAQRALAWSRPGDLLLLLCHAERAAVLQLLSALQEKGWSPGKAVVS